jgi:hypothetical protein
MLAKNRNHHYTAVVMSDLSPIGRSGTTASAGLRARAGAYAIAAQRLNGEKGAEDFFGPGGQRNPLKTLDSDKEIQAFFLDYLCRALARLG